MSTENPDPILCALEELESILDALEEDLDALRGHLTQPPAAARPEPPAA